MEVHWPVTRLGYGRGKNAGRPQQQRPATSFMDSLLQTLASLLVNHTSLEQKLEEHLATRVNMHLVPMCLLSTYRRAM